jgi:hypothetical protein
LHTATSKAGQHLNIPLLDTLRQGAPADLIAIHGDILNPWNIPIWSFQAVKLSLIILVALKIGLSKFTIIKKLVTLG